MINQNTKDYNVTLTISVYQNYGTNNASIIDSYEYTNSANISDLEYYNGQNITFEYKFDISEDSNSITQILINDQNIKPAFNDEDNISNIDIEDVTINELSTYDDTDDIKHFKGEYLVTTNNKSTTNTITLKGSSVGLPTSKDYMSTIRCYTKLYYWGCFKTEEDLDVDTDNVFVYYKYNESNNEDGNLTQYLDSTDTIHTVDKLPSIKMEGSTLPSTELYIDGIDEHEAYIYIMIPEYCTSNIKLGVGTQLFEGGFEKLYENQEPFTITEFDNGIKYYLYRTDKPQSGQVNIQIG
jgi:hypothetical protein